MQLPPIDRIASFDVDSQRTFTPLCPDELPAEGGDEIGPELNRQAQLARWRLGSKDSHSPKAVWVTDDPDKIGQPGVEGATSRNTGRCTQSPAPKASSSYPACRARPNTTFSSGKAWSWTCIPMAPATTTWPKQ